MASVVKIKRSAVQGKAPTTSDITTGEIALNTRDGKLFSSDGSSVFEIGANTTSSTIGTLTVGNTNPFTLPTTDGSDGQVLKTNGSGTVTWQDDARQTLTVNANTSINTATIVDRFAKASYRSAKYTAQVSNIDGHQVSDVLVLHSNNTVHFTEFGQLCVSSKASLGNFGATIVGANVNLTFTPTTAAYHSVISLNRTLIEVNDAEAFEGDAAQDFENDNGGVIDLGSVAEASTASDDWGSVA